ncbi:MAG: hypothetical protein U9R32_04260 [Bacteroidota bacterium]|nr:hypothetical protein [Bacteroidota bacterium]
MLSRFRSVVFFALMILLMISAFGCSTFSANSKQRKAEKVMIKHERENVIEKERLSKEHFKRQSERSKNEMRRLKKKAKKINRDRKSDKFFLWRWLGM